MARGNRTLRVGLILALAGCATTTWRDRTEPVTVADLGRLPEKITPENSRDVVRKCLQRHRSGETSIHDRYGYVFRKDGFVQLHDHHPMDRGRDRHARTYVDYATVESVTSRVVLDTARLRQRVEVTVRGRFRRWETERHPYRDDPELNQEPSAVDASTLLLRFDDAEAARALGGALRILAGN